MSPPRASGSASDLAMRGIRGASLAEDPDEVRAAFIEERDAYLRQVEGWLGRARGRHHLAPTDQPMAPVLSRLLGGA